MIDAKYAVKYPMPHSVVHIVDNSMYAGELPTMIADDPSLYSTIVVTATPMGEDNKVIKILRSDIAATAYGLGSLTTDDVKKYGQSVTYPMSLINQNSPVQLLRITPEGSTYAVGILLVQWRVDTSAKKFHVRFKEGELPADLILERFKNKERLHNQLVKALANNSVTDADGTTWKQAVFATFIGAGRGAIYNNFNVAVNFVPQNKRPANAKYEFITIDNRISKTIERFNASLVNIDNSRRTDYVETVNNTVAHRAAGSSIVVPTINEDVVKVIFKEYMANYKTWLSEETMPTSLQSNCFANINVNTFDILYGNYIYEGSDGRDAKLPYFQVDMFDTNIPYLKEEYRIKLDVATPETYDPKDPAKLYQTLQDNFTIGFKESDPVRIGDMYLTTVGSNNTKPLLSMVAGVNQYTGSVTTITIPKIFPLDDSGSGFDTTSRAIKVIFGDGASNGTGSNVIKSLVKSGEITPKDIVARVSGNTFSLFTVLTATSSDGSYTLTAAYTDAQVRQSLDWASHSSGAAGTGNVVGRTVEHTAFTRPGATVLDTATGDVYVNNYDYTYDSSASISDKRIKVTTSKCIFGKVPVEISQTTDVIGTYYDLLVFKTGVDVTTPDYIYRYLISGIQGSLFRVSYDPIKIPNNYYSADYGVNLSSELGGISLKAGSTGFFDDAELNSIEFKWRYSALLVKAFRGEIDPRIMSPTRVPAKYLFDGGTNTIVGQTMQSYISYDPIDIINASSIFTEDEKEDIMYDKTLVANITESDDIDVKQAMYDFMVERCYQRIPEDKRPVGPGSGLQLNLDAGVTDANTAMLMNSSFAKRFDNPNAVWDIGGWHDAATGLTYTYVKKIVDSLFTHIAQTSINKPFVGAAAAIKNNEYISYFPDIDTTDWELRKLMYNSGGNVWVVNVNEDIERRSQRTLYRVDDTSDIIQESNMRTLSQLVYLVQNEIDASLLEYDDDGVLKTLEDTINIKFSTWVGEVVQALSIRFERDKNTDGGDLLVCYINVTFRGLILRVPIIVNVDARTES